MVAALEKIYPVSADFVNDSMFLGYPAGPYIRPQVFQVLRLTYSGERRFFNILDKMKYFLGSFFIFFYPILQIFAEFRLKDGFQ